MSSYHHTIIPSYHGADDPETMRKERLQKEEAKKAKEALRLETLRKEQV